MHKRLLGAALAMSALLAGHQATQPRTPSQAPDLQQTRDVATKAWPLSVRAQKPVPTKPTTPAAKQRVQLEARPLAYLGSPFRFPPQPSRRKVKYGKSRWIILG